MGDYSKKAFWVATGERAVKTFAQVAAASFGVGTGLYSWDWQASLSVSGAAGILSILTSIGTATISSTGGPGITEVPAANVDAAVETALADENARQGRLNKHEAVDDA